MRSKLLIALFLVASFVQVMAQNKFYLFGGSQKDVLLGCINCSDQDAQSIWNPNTIYGSTTGAFSIWNTQGIYGADYSHFSPFNPSASDPPVIKDQTGRFYGYFTIDRFRKQRFESEWTEKILNDKS